MVKIFKDLSNELQNNLEEELQSAENIQCPPIEVKLLPKANLSSQKNKVDATTLGREGQKGDKDAN